MLPISSVTVVGAGGNGSIFISHLCRIWHAWVKLGGAPFSITLIDPDVVSASNLARQCYCEADIGSPKAAVLAQRMGAFFGVPIKPVIDRFRSSDSSIMVGCVDNLDARRTMADSAKSHKCYWLDMGNTNDSGQVVLGGHGLKTFFDLYPKQRRAKDPKDIPSCSMAESLARQDLFINSTVATLGGQLLWQLMRHGGLNHHGYVINLSSGLVLPLKV